MREGDVRLVVAVIAVAVAWMGEPLGGAFLWLGYEVGMANPKEELNAK